ncbi:MAG: NUDIX hydrolase [Bacteroidales bacterium]|nr:NUDIX hydrolase [Bacteroidales bacterium]
MDNTYKGHKEILVAVDCIVFGFDNEGLKLLLIKRNFEPAKGKWSLMGGFVKQDESLDDAAKRVLYDLTGLKDIYLEQLYTYGTPGRDKAGRVLSVAYFALIKTQEYDKAKGEAYGAKWFRFNEKPALIFDHDEMVLKAHVRLIRRVRYRPVGFELLPEKFTLPQLQMLYEAIYQEELDKRNFRKKILSMGLLIKLGEKDKSGSKKGAFLYKFNEALYEEFEKKGFFFELK